MTRLVSGVAMAAVALALIFFAPMPVVRVVACGVAWLAAAEYLRLVGGSRGLAAAAAAACWLVSGGGATALMAAVVLALGAAAWRVLVGRDAPGLAAAGAFGVLYVGIPLGWLVALHARYAWPITVLVVSTVVVSDSAQYYTGRLLGRRPLAPAISPKKTIEGALGGLACGTAFLAVSGPYALPGVTPWHLPLLGALVVVLGICGDLFESQIKRLASVKDSGALIPGHGGVLDRIDALLFVVPAFALYLSRVA